MTGPHSTVFFMISKSIPIQRAAFQSAYFTQPTMCPVHMIWRDSSYCSHNTCTVQSNLAYPDILVVRLSVQICESPGYANICISMESWYLRAVWITVSSSKRLRKYSWCIRCFLVRTNTMCWYVFSTKYQSPENRIFCVKLTLLQVRLFPNNFYYYHYHNYYWCYYYNHIIIIIIIIIMLGVRFHRYSSNHLNSFQMRFRSYISFIY